MKTISLSIFFLALNLYPITSVHSAEEKLDLPTAQSLLADIEKDREGAIRQRIVGLLGNYEATGLSEQFQDSVLSFLAACSAEKMIAIEESMTAEELVAYSNDAERSSADDEKIASECLEVLQVLVNAQQQ